MTKPIVDTCGECRAWQPPSNEIRPSISLPTKFGEEGEADFLFYKRYLAWHIIDRAIKLRDGCQIPNKETCILLDAYVKSWVQGKVPFQFLYVDGEGGLNTDSAKTELQRLGTTLRTRAPRQHARLIGSRNGAMRHVMHLIGEDLKWFGTEITFIRLFGEALFVCNAFTLYNGVAPYNAYTRRQPAYLPDLENPDFDPNGETNTGEREKRIRQAGISAITQSTAAAKINRALKAKTNIDASTLNKPCDLIMNYHRPPRKTIRQAGMDHSWLYATNQNVDV